MRILESHETVPRPSGAFSVCVYCGSSPAAPSAHLALAAELGGAIAQNGWRYVYGGGGLGLMGAGALAAHDSGGAVLGILPRFLEQREPPPAHIPLLRVDTMHERKWLMFRESDAFVVLPGGIGTLEELVEVTSWMRLDLHKKPIIVLGRAYWTPFYQLLDHMTEARYMPAGFTAQLPLADSAAEAVDLLRLAAEAVQAPEAAQ